MAQMHKSSQKPSFHQTLHLITDEQSNVNWKNSQSKNIDCKKGKSRQKIKKSMTPNVPKDEFEISPWICREVKTLSSLESNCESEMSEDEMTTDETSAQKLDMDNDYIAFCSDLTKSPCRDAASSTLFCASVFSGSFSFTIAGDDEDDVIGDDDDEEDNLGDDEDDGIGRLEAGDDFKSLQFSNGLFSSLSSGKVEHLMMPGLFLPSLLSPEIFDVQPSLIFGAASFCGAGCSKENEEEELTDNERLKEVNRRWRQEYESSVISANDFGMKSADQPLSRKMVHFATEDIFIGILNAVEWADDYEAARKGPWEQYYRDHLRFAKRIESVSQLLSGVLESSHRTTVFRNLYEDADKVAGLVGVPDESVDSNLTAAHFSSH